jgi:hypothetical protein
MVHPCGVLLCCPRHVAPLRRRCAAAQPVFCCFRGELAAAPLRCIRTVVTDTRSMALAGEPIPPFCFAAHPRRPDGNRYRAHAAHNRQQHTPHTDMTRGVQQTAARTAYAAQRAAMARSIGAPPHPHGAHGVSAGSRSARGGRSASARRRTPPATPLPRTRCVRALACACPGGGWRGTLQQVRHVAPAAAVGAVRTLWVRLAARRRL